KPVRLAVDTGAEATMLFHHTAERLQLQVTNAPADHDLPPGKVALGVTEPCDLTLWNTTIRTTLGVIDIPVGLRAEIEGVLGWPSLKNSIFQIDAVKQEVEFMDTTPEKATAWLKFQLRTNAETLIMIVPNQASQPVGVTVDTGSEYGVSLNPY